MEPNRSIGSTIQRKPLADCTNTVSKPTQPKKQPPSSSSASLVKFANPSLTSSLKRLVDQTTLKEKPKDVVKSKGSDEIVAPKKRSVARRMSADLDFPATAPPKPRSDRVVSENVFAEPYSVYTSRRKRRSKETSSSAALPRLRLDLVPSSGKKTPLANEKKSEPLKVTPKKRQRTVKHEKDELVHGVPKDYIEKQRAYFAEVDAFELPEEEVSSSDLD